MGGNSGDGGGYPGARGLLGHPGERHGTMGRGKATDLPSAASVGYGAMAFTTNGRKNGEGAAAGTGIPVWSDGVNWRTFYDNSIVGT